MGAILHYQGASPAPYQVTNPDGSVINYQYISALNNAIAEVRFGEITRKLEYEAVTGRLNKISENNGMSHTFIYNDAGLLNQEQIVLPNQRQRTNYYKYSLANRLISYSGAGNETTVYSYDANGKLNSIIDRGIRVNLNYDKLGRYIGQFAHYEVGGNSVETKLSLDEFGREFKREVIENNKTKITMFEIEQDIPANNKIANKKLYLNKRLLREENYSYDLFGRVMDYKCFGDIQPETPEGKKYNSKIIMTAQNR